MENKKLFGLICYLQRQMRRENNNLFADYGITPIQLDSLVYVYVQNKSGKNVCQKGIEKYVNLRPSSTSSLLNTLEKSGFIKRTVAEDDARTKYVTLTEKGESLCVRNKMLVDKCDAVIQCALSEAEQATLKNLLKKIITEIDKQEVK